MIASVVDPPDIIAAATNRVVIGERQSCSAAVISTKECDRPMHEHSSPRMPGRDRW
ncbi:MAG TPA: hypothetical protein VK707_02255 [Solirubrobacteraceae bacterium]|nr:hypothetical protein [Solirubrobacteraceae bacterium]